ncbi:hypothetical protein PM082_024438 [Marasmius tenuissimus]|nr:hypothetical protein PM082_024438 [Marasmius tenuissimus]
MSRRVYTHVNNPYSRMARDRGNSPTTSSWPFEGEFEMTSSSSSWDYRGDEVPGGDAPGFVLTVIIDD